MNAYLDWFKKSGEDAKRGTNVFSETGFFCDRMSRKSKGAVLDPYGIEGAKARLKFQALMQDYHELEKVSDLEGRKACFSFNAIHEIEADVMRSKLDMVKDRKLMLAAEVRFLRKRHRYLVKTKDVNSPQEQNLVQTPNLLKRAKITKQQLLIGKEASQHRLPLAPEPISKKKLVALPDTFPVSDQPRKKKTYSRKGHGIPPPVFDLNHKGVMRISKEANIVAALDRNSKERIFGANDAMFRNSNSAATFDLNLETIPSEREVSLPTRAPIFDLNEISTGEEDFQGSGEANKFDDTKKSLMRGINEEQQNDLKLSICRNAGEGSSRAGKRKISWQDPVALRV
ncbi:hypothetical protein SASPL_155912 [Salvia splendens]|uniref:Uncharacterized protein n=1 Tax=Salvia splendens TaxID=180675 RepID=A0A8X8YWN8_SALSN|nr:hypothetical protein SASPL_155912 [Salvia splendens]